MIESAPAKTGSTTPVLNCLTLQLADRHLLIPSAAVAEVVSMLEVEPRAEMPDWYLGEVIWRDLQVPLICFETLSSGEKVRAPEVPRLLVLNSTAGVADFHFFALRLNDIPSPMKIDPEVLRSAGEALEPFELDSVYIGHELYKLPDLPAVEKELEQIGLI